MTTERKWSIEQEISLFSLVSDFKPAGSAKDHNVSEILLRINQDNKEEKFTEEQVWAKLRHYYNLEKVDAIEDDLEEGVIRPHIEKTPRSSERVNLQAISPDDPLSGKNSDIFEKETDVVKSEDPLTVKNDPKTSPELDSSELSDVEGEETELEKLSHQEPHSPPKPKPKRGRPKKIRPAAKDTPVKAVPPKETVATPRKRTRSVPDKGDIGEEHSVKRRQSTPLSTRRKTRAGNTPEVEPTPTKATKESSVKAKNRENVEKEVNDSGDQAESASPEPGALGSAESGSKEEPKEDPKEATNSPQSALEDSPAEATEEENKDTIADETKDDSAVEDEAKGSKPRRQAVRRSTRKK